ncbi:MAG: class I SAM-dependent methyltransferase [Propionibacteriaceae bacterium]
MSHQEYLLADQPSELERLQLQSRIWEPAGRQLLSKLGDRSGGRALDVGCGALGWLRILSEWTGPSGQVVGTDIDERLLEAARSFLEAEGITNVELVVDDLFESKLESDSFDLVHARYVIAPLGRGREQVASFRRLVRPDGYLALEGMGPGLVALQSPGPGGRATDTTACGHLRHARRRSWAGPSRFAPRDRDRRARDRRTRRGTQAGPPLSASPASVQRRARVAAPGVAE